MEIELNTLCDKELVELTLSGELRAYDALTARHIHALREYLGRRITQRGIREEIIQDCFIKAYLNLTQYKVELAFGCWLFAIARNCHIDYLRRTRSTDLPIEQYDKPCGAMNPEQRIISDQNSLHIERVMERLPESYSRIVRLRFWDELSYEEIATTLDMPLGTVKTHIHRARTMLMQMLSNF
ncbi:MAG: sigma-70 family RNA polymerase sigma factor [Mucinivorans sp.]